VQVEKSNIYDVMTSGLLFILLHMITSVGVEAVGRGSCITLDMQRTPGSNYCFYGLK